MVDVYLSLYKSVTHWGSIEELAAALNFTEIVAQDAATYYSSQGVGDAFLYEVIEASARVNYGQNIDKIHGLEGLVSMAANGAKQIKGGNYQIFEHFLHRSRAFLHLETEVLGIGRKADKKWTLTTKSHQNTAKSSPITRDFDAVILAAPFDKLGITLPSNTQPITPTPYVHLHVTLLTTKSPAPNPSYFRLEKGSDVPTMILTSAQGSREGKPAPEFNSLSYHGTVIEGKDEWVVKIFSTSKVEDEWLHKVFDHVGWVHRKEVCYYFKCLETNTDVNFWM
jgi:prenylcysteine oxidase / farnesylcysteine lyase